MSAATTSFVPPATDYQPSTPAFTPPATDYDPSQSAKTDFQPPSTDVASPELFALDHKSPEELAKDATFKPLQVFTQNEPLINEERLNKLVETNRLLHEQGLTAGAVAEATKNAGAGLANFVKGGYELGKHLFELSPVPLFLNKDYRDPEKVKQNYAELIAGLEAQATNLGNTVRGAARNAVNQEGTREVADTLGLPNSVKDALGVPKVRMTGDIMTPSTFFKPVDWKQRFLADASVIQQQQKILNAQGPAAEFLGAGGVKVNPEVVNQLSSVEDPTLWYPFLRGLTVAKAASGFNVMTGGGKVLANTVSREAAENFVKSVGSNIAKAGAGIEGAADKVGVVKGGLGGMVLHAAGVPVTGGAVAGSALAGKVGGRLVTYFGEAVANPKLTLPVLEYGAQAAKGAAEGGAFGAAFASGADTPEEQLSTVEGGALLGASGATVGHTAGLAHLGALRQTEKFIASQFREAPDTRPVADFPAYGTDSALDADHAKSMAALNSADPATANLVNRMRAVLAPAKAELYLVSPEELQKQAGLLNSEKLPFGLAQKVTNPDGSVTQRVLVRQVGKDVPAIFHEPGHVLIDLMPAEQRQKFFDAIQKYYTPEELAKFHVDQIKNLPAGAPTPNVLHEVGAELISGLLRGVPLEGVPSPLRAGVNGFVARVLEGIGLFKGSTVQGESAPGVTEGGVRISPNAVKPAQDFLSQFLSQVQQKEAVPPVIQHPPVIQPGAPASPVSPETPAAAPEAAKPVAPVAPVTPAPAAPPPEPTALFTPPAEDFQPHAEQPAQPQITEPNLRVSRGQQNAFENTPERTDIGIQEAAPNVKPENQEVFNTLRSALREPQGQVKPVEIVMRSVEPEGSATERTERRAEQEADASRVEAQKLIIPTGFVTTKEGKVQVTAMSPDKVLANASRIVQEANDKGVSDLIPYQSKDGRLTPDAQKKFEGDLETYLQNQAAGYRGDGKSLERPADLQGGFIPPVNPDYRPVELGKNEANFLNLIMGVAPPRTNRVNKNKAGQPITPTNVRAYGLAKLNNKEVLRPANIRPGDLDKQVYKDYGNQSISEFNPLRKKLDEAGVNTRERIEVTERLNLENIVKAAPRPENRLRAGVTDVISAGFMPGKADEEAHFMPSSEPRAIRAAAVRDTDGRIYEGPAHLFAYSAWHESHPGQVPDINKMQEGFVTNEGEFLGRKEAFKRAHEMEQVVRNYATRGNLLSEQMNLEGNEATRFMPSKNIPVQIEKPDGTREDAEFSGYWLGFPGDPANVGRKLPDGKVSHGMLRPGEKIIGDVPTLAEWKIGKDRFMPAKGPNEDVRKVADEYVKSAGLKEPLHTGNQQLNPALAKRIADFYQEAQHEPDAPAVKKSYDAFAKETKAQWDFVTSKGVKMEPWTKEGQPYANSAERTADIRDNNHLWFFPTDSGFGTTNVASHPLLAPTGIEVDGRPLLVNDLFRAVHDYFGHAKEGYEFGPRGELNAFLSHVRMYSPEARPAMAAETLGQNSWVNFGKHLRDAEGNIPAKGEPGYVPLTERPFAEQKAFNLPEHLIKPVLDNEPPIQRFMPAKQKAESTSDEYFRARQSRMETQPKFWLDKNGNQKPVKFDHARTAAELLKQAFKEEDREKYNSAMMERGDVRAQIYANTLFADGIPLTFDKLSKAQRTALEDASFEKDAPIVYNGEYVESGYQGDETTTRFMPAKRKEKTLDLVHYSNTEGLKKLEPSYYGSGLTGAERLRKKSYPEFFQDRTYFGMKGYEKEPGLGDARYKAKVPVSKLYDAAKDPDNLYPTSAELESRGLAPFDREGAFTIYEKKIKEAGYSGFFNKSLQMVAKFDPTDVTRFMPGNTPKPEEFQDPDKIERALRKPNWAILTATQEAKGPASAKENVEANKELHAQLQSEGYKPILLVNGFYKGVDQGTSFLVTGIDPREAMRLGKQYSQESVLVPQGLLYGDGTVNPTDFKKNIVGAKAKSQDFYSEVQGGPAFTLGIDFDKRQPLEDSTTRFMPAKQEELFGSKSLPSTGNVRELSPAEIKKAFPEAVVPKLTESGSKQKVDYGIVDSPLVKGLKKEEQKVSAFADRLVQEADKWKNSEEFKAGAKWYSEFVPMLREWLGDKAQEFGELLAAASPRTDPEVNFGYAVKAFEGWQRGEYDAQIKKYNEGLTKLEDGSLEKWYNKNTPKENRPAELTPANLMGAWIQKNKLIPTQWDRFTPFGESREVKFGMHGERILQVMARRWMDGNAGLKTNQFVRNLTGADHGATIDVWAARLMRRLGYDTKPGARWRILPEMEKSVSDPDFLFSQKVFAQAAEKLGMQPDDLQGAMWFAEKKHWANNGWQRLNLGDYRKELHNFVLKRKLEAAQGNLFDAPVIPLNRVASSGAGPADRKGPDLFQIQPRKNLKVAKKPVLS